MNLTRESLSKIYNSMRMEDRHSLSEYCGYEKYSSNLRCLLSERYWHLSLPYRVGRGLTSMLEDMVGRGDYRYNRLLEEIGGHSIIESDIIVYTLAIKDISSLESVYKALVYELDNRKMELINHGEA